MFRVTSLANISDRQLDRLIRRVGLLLLAATIAFVGFYVFDRWRPPQPTIVNREMAALEVAVREDPANISARGRLADTYALAGMYEEAIEQYGLILETGKADTPAYLGRARAYQQLGSLGPAAEDFRQVIALAREGEMAHVDMTLQAAYYGLGSLAFAEGNLQEAITQLTAALRINRADADSLLLVGRAYTATGQTNEAVESLRRAIAFVPLGWAEPYAALAEAYTAAGDAPFATWAGAMASLSAGDPEAAAAALHPLLEGPAGLDAAIGLGLIAEAGGDTATAAQWYRTALEIAPGNVAAGMALQRVAGGPAELQPLPRPGELGGSD